QENGGSAAPASEAGRVSAACTGVGQPRRDEHAPVLRTVPLSAVGRGWRRAAKRLRQRRESVAVERSFAAEGNQCAAGVGSESLAVDSTVANRECVARKFRRAGGRVVRDLDQGWFAGSERLGGHKNEGFWASTQFALARFYVGAFAGDRNRVWHCARVARDES